MRNTFITLLLLASFLIPASLTYAHEGEDRNNLNIDQTQKNKEKKDLSRMIKQKEADRRQEIKDSVSAKLTEDRKVIITNHWQKLMARLNAAVARLEKLIQRIESRVAAIKENNPQADIDEISTKITEAKTKLTEAKTKLSALESVVNEAIASDEPKAAFEVIHNTVKEIKTLLLQVHRILVHIIGDIKGLRIEEKN